MTRKEAQAAGEMTYHGKPCKNCGNTEKYTSSWSCVECARERARALHCVENMTPEQIERKRASDRVANMTPEQLERHRARNRERMRREWRDPDKRLKKKIRHTLWSLKLSNARMDAQEEARYGNNVP